MPSATLARFDTFEEYNKFRDTWSAELIEQLRGKLIASEYDEMKGWSILGAAEDDDAMVAALVAENRDFSRIVFDMIPTGDSFIGVGSSLL